MAINKKVVFVSNTSFSLYNFRLGLMKKLKELGYDVVCIAPVDDYTEYLKGEFSFYPLRNLDRKGKNPVKDFLLLIEFIKLYHKLKPNLVINFTIKPNIYSSFACGLLRIPSISVVTGLGYVFLRGGLLEKIVRVLYRVAFSFNSFVIILNRYDFNIISTITNKSKIILIDGEGINTLYFSPEFCNDIHKSTKTVFLFIGRFLRDKGLMELVNASKALWRERKDFELWLLGGPDWDNPQSISKEEIEAISKYAFIKIFPFTKDVRPLICQSDCVILPSYREGLPRSLLEAMSMEKSIITTESPGCQDVCENGINGFLVKPRDVEDLKRAMRSFLELSEEERTNMGKKGREIVLKRFDERYVIEKYLDLITKIV